MNTIREINQNRTRVSVPDDVEVLLRLFRAGTMWSVPNPYIEFHQKLATESLDQIRRIATVYDVRLVDDGWCDGMKFVQAIIEFKGKLMKIKWSDGQHWFEQMPSGGWGLI